MPNSEDGPRAEARSITWMLGASLPTELIQLPELDGASVTLRSVSVDDQERWREKRKSQMMGYGALGDKGDVLARSYTYVPIPEWLLDSCTACVEVRRSADLPTHIGSDGELYKAAFAVTDANQIDFASTAAVDLVRLLLTSSQVQVPVTELIIVATRGNHIHNSHIWSTPGFLWRHARERWVFPAAQMPTLSEWWRSASAGLNADTIRWPLRRFGIAQQRAFSEDRLVDLAIALEAIFMREEDPQRNTGGQIATKANKFLGGSRTAAKLRTKELIDAYHTRSNVVHGRLPPEEDVDLANKGMETVLGEALRAIITATTKVNPASAPVTSGLGGPRPVHPSDGRRPSLAAPN